MTDTDFDDIPIGLSLTELLIESTERQVAFYQAEIEESAGLWLDDALWRRELNERRLARAEKRLAELRQEAA